MQIDMKAVFGTPALAFINMQLYYSRELHIDDPTYKRDHAWFVSHPRQLRVIRPARGNEFNQADAHIDYGGKRIAAPQLYVLVEPRFARRDFVVTPIYRGTCFWPIDGRQYCVAENPNDDEGNAIVDKLLFQIHGMQGVCLLEIQQHAERIAEVALANAAPHNQKVN